MRHLVQTYKEKCDQVEKVEEVPVQGQKCQTVLAM
jgi:hypothetical protein